jgi:hypothetical protein
LIRGLCPACPFWRIAFLTSFLRCLSSIAKTRIVINQSWNEKTFGERKPMFRVTGITIRLLFKTKQRQPSGATLVHPFARQLQIFKIPSY